MRIHDAVQGTAHRKRKRLGRGNGSGQGGTSGKGHKGARARSGWKNNYGYEGGQMSFVRRLPKRGFNNKIHATRFDIVNVAQLETAFEPGDVVNLESVREKLKVKDRHGYLKVLGFGELSKKLSLEVHGISASARKKVEDAGGTVELLRIKPVIVKGQKKADRIKTD